MEIGEDETDDEEQVAPKVWPRKTFDISKIKSRRARDYERYLVTKVIILSL